MTNRIAWLILSAALLFCVCAGVAGFLFFRVAPVLSEPATCKEFAEMLESRGVPVYWHNKFGGPGNQSVWIIDKTTPNIIASARVPMLCDSANEGHFHDDAPILSVTQFSTAAAANESAGATQNSFAYGRFVIRRHSSREMHEKFFEKVRKSLQ